MLKIEINIYRGKAIENLMPTITEWVTSQYKSFPFLYVAQGEVPPNYVLMEDPNAFVLFAEKGSQKLGLLMAIPLNSPLLNVKYSPFPVLNEVKAKGFDLNKILYVASFLMAKEARQDKDLIQCLYQQAVTLATKIGKTRVCYFTTLREENHPLKPNPYIPPEPWEDLTTSSKSMGITFNLTWPTLQADGSVKECANVQELYFQDI